jgi:hypothetical protein
MRRSRSDQPGANAQQLHLHIGNLRVDSAVLGASFSDGLGIEVALCDAITRRITGSGSPAQMRAVTPGVAALAEAVAKAVAREMPPAVASGARHETGVWRPA